MKDHYYTFTVGLPNSSELYQFDSSRSKFIGTDSRQVSLCLTRPLVAYNPLKGINFTRKLIKKYKNLVFIPIDKMSKLEVIDLLKDAMIYIDFGNHPGQDRIPREAAIYGCCLITSKRGSAAYKQDIPIPEKYKINDEDINLDKIGNLIIEIFNNYNYKFAEFECYRNYCKLTNDRFINDFYKCFKIIK